MNFRRAILRWQLKNGKLKLDEYRRCFNKVDVGVKDDEVNAPIRLRAKWLLNAIKQIGPHGPLTRELENMLAQLYLVEVVYNPTKGFHFRRGAHVMTEIE